MRTTVFFADVLGFSELSTSGAADGAERALDDVALLFSDQEELMKYLQVGSTWKSRYGLSDSIFLLADDVKAAAREAAKFFFRLAYLNASVPEQRVLMRGAIARGEVKERGPIFPESASRNVVGEGIVQAVLLEKSGAKGPRLLISKDVAAELQSSDIAWIIDDAEGISEILWILPPDVADVDISHLRVVCRAAAEAFIHADERVAEHYIAYVDLLLRSLLRLKSVQADVAVALAHASRIEGVRRRLEVLSLRRSVEQRALSRADQLLR